FGSAGSTPIDTRPVRPPWMPGFPLASPGWQSSSTPLCDTSAGTYSGLGVWADQRGVFALAAHSCALDSEGFVTDCGQSGLSLQFNPGTGWQNAFSVWPDSDGRGFAVSQLTGFPGGSVLAVDALIQGQAGIFAIDQGTATAQATGADAPSQVFVVDATTAYGVSGTHVLRYEAGTWVKFADVPSEMYSVWADTNRVVVAGTQVYQSPTAAAGFTQVPNAPVGSYWGVWGFGSNEIWISAGDQLAEYDGNQWNLVDASSLGATGAMWGMNGVLFFSAGGGLGRISSGQLDVSIPATGAGYLTVTGVWGRSLTEVFVSMNDEHGQHTYACGGDFMVWFDGAQFHQF
ncbi:MAG TPA: hypothetical protein VGM29_12930, partial [Polyangiaceae bacterium]